MEGVINTIGRRKCEEIISAGRVKVNGKVVTELGTKVNKKDIIEVDGHLVDFDEAMKRQQIYKTVEGRAVLRAKEGATHHGGCGHCN